MLIKEFLSVVGIALAGASIVLLATHVFLKVFKPDAFKATQPPKVQTKKVIWTTLAPTVQPSLKEIPFATVQFGNSASEIPAGVFAPGGQSVSLQSTAVPNSAAQKAFSGAANGALGSTAS